MTEKELKMRKELSIPDDKECFEFSYTRPFLDWYETIKVKIAPTDYYYYYYFKLEKRFDDSWWLIGCKSIEKYPYWEYKELGQLDYNGSTETTKEFIEWAKCKNNKGSRIISISAISGEFNLIEEIKKLID